MRRERFQARFWGVRGSYPTSSSETLKFGGHTSCVEIRAGAHRLIFDAGTGIIALGREMLQAKGAPLRLSLFLSHTHHDHIMGFCFFEPLLKAGTRVFVYGPDANGASLETTLRTVMNSQLFPIGFHELKARKEIISLHGGETLRLNAARDGRKIRTERRVSGSDDEVIVATHKSHAHPRNGVLLYRVHYRNKSVVYATDIEQQKGGYPDVIEFVSGADLLIHDAQYLHSEYFSKRDSKKGWGHSTIERAAEVARKAGVKRLVLFHHEPTHHDQAIRAIEGRARRLFANTTAAYEGMTVDLI
jgi:ribonuclease BN (tRNA processing enzyme)